MKKQTKAHHIGSWILIVIGATFAAWISIVAFAPYVRAAFNN